MVKFVLDSLPQKEQVSLTKRNLANETLAVCASCFLVNHHNERSIYRFQNWRSYPEIPARLFV
jgi:hypothetical protein